MKTLFCIPLILSCLAISSLSSDQPRKSNVSGARSLVQNYQAKNRLLPSTQSLVQKMDSSHFALIDSSGQLGLAKRRMFSHYSDGKISKMVLWKANPSTGWDDQGIDSSFYSDHGFLYQTKTYEKIPGNDWISGWRKRQNFSQIRQMRF